MLTTTVQGRTWEFSHSIGRVGPAEETFLWPYSVATSDSDLIYVINRGPDPKLGDGNRLSNVNFKRIGKWKLDDEFVSDFAQNDLMWPVSLAVDKKGSLYCTDEIKNKILKYNSEDHKVLEWGVEGSAEGELSKPAGIASDLEGDLYVVDAGNHRIQKFSNNGDFIHSWGEFGSDLGQLNDPWGITVDLKGFVYVADWGNNRVQKFTGNGEWLQNFGVSFPEDLRLNHPSDVAVDSEGDVYVADWGNKKVQIFDSDGEIITSLHGDATELSRSALNFMEVNEDYYKAFKRAKDKSRLGLFERPTSISITKDDRIVICDTARQRLQVYDKEKGYTEPQYNL